MNCTKCYNLKKEIEFYSCQIYSTEIFNPKEAGCKELKLFTIKNNKYIKEK